MKVSDLQNISAAEWLNLLEDKYTSPKFLHLDKELTHEGKARHSTQDLMQSGMSSVEAELRLEAESQVLVRNKAMSDLKMRLNDVALELQDLSLKKKQLVIDVYIKNETDKSQKLNDLNDEIKRAENVQQDVELAIQLTEQYFNSILLRIDSQLDNILR